MWMIIIRSVTTRNKPRHTTTIIATSKQQYKKDSCRRDLNVGIVSKKITPIMSSSLSPEIEQCHENAVKNGKLNYMDPQTGFFVFTELAALERGYCCGMKCRHCPYGHFNVVPPVNLNQARSILPKSTVILKAIDKAKRKTLILKTQEEEKAFHLENDPSFLFLSQSNIEKTVDAMDRIAKLFKNIVLVCAYNIDSGLVDADLHLYRVMDVAIEHKKTLIAIPCNGNDDVNIPRHVFEGIFKYLQMHHCNLERIASNGITLSFDCDEADAKRKHVELFSTAFTNCNYRFNFLL